MSNEREYQWYGYTNEPWNSGRIVWIEEYDGGHRFVAIDGPDYGVCLVQADEHDAEQAANIRLLENAPQTHSLLDEIRCRWLMDVDNFTIDDLMPQIQEVCTAIEPMDLTA